MQCRIACRRMRLARVGLIVAALAAQPLIWSAPASASITVTSHFIWTATSSNASGFVSVINNGATNGLPNALLFVTPNNTPGGVCGCVVDTAPIGVVYNVFGNGRWSIFNEDESNIPDGAQFNVLVVQHSNAYVFVQNATAANTSGDSTTIDATQTNGKPNALLQITQVGNGSVTFNNHVVGVTYANNHAMIFNEDTSAMPVGLRFNVMVGASKSNGGKAALLQTQFGSGSDSIISNARTTGNPNAVILDTANLDPAYIGGVYDTSPTGVRYLAGRTDKWAVTQEDGSAMGNGSAFNLLIFSS